MRVNFTVFIVLMIFQIQLVFAQRSISGTIRDSDGFGLTGATIYIEGTQIGTTAGIDGEFSLEVPSDETILIVTYIGFNPQKIIVGDRSIFNIILEENIELLNEIIVVGYGEIKKSDLTGSVGSVDTEQIQKIATVDIGRAIQGKVAGVQVTTNSGAPGSGTSVRVRGIGSFSNSNPLYVVDGFLTDDISNVSPNDIENIEVLKDASATAIYGSRGANGVVIVTTKKGLSNGVQVEFNGYYGTQSAWKTIDLLNANDYAQTYLDLKGGQLSGIESEDLRQWIQQTLAGNNSGTEWQSEVLQNAPIQSYDISVRGGFKKLRYSFGGTHFKQDGVVINSYGKRSQGNVDLEFKVTDKLSLSGGLKYSINENTVYDQGTYSSVLGTAVRKDPVNPVLDPVTGNWDRTNLTDIENPARLGYISQFRIQESERLQPTFGITYKITNALTFRSNVIWDKRDITGNYLRPIYTTVESKNLGNNGQPIINPQETNTTEELQVQTNKLNVLQNSNTISYDKSINDHSINAVLGFETYQSDISNITEQVFTDSIGVSDPLRERAFNLMSYFARAVYSYKSKYLLTATVRRDGSSKFPEENRWGTFPSFSAGWNVDRESFFPESKIISGLKIRGGWGEVGNQEPIQPYAFYSVLSPGWQYAFDNNSPSQGYAPTFIPSESITWEVSRMSNVGLDFYFLDNRLSLSTEYYIKDTKDLLVDSRFVPAPVFAGAQAPTSNAGAMTNKGLEITLDFKQKFKSFSFNVGGNIAFITNEVTAIGAANNIQGAAYEAKTQIPATRTVVGGEFGAFYGLKSQGIFQSAEEVDAHGAQPTAQPGDVKWLDHNNDGEITIEDAVLLGSPIPDFTYGFYLNVEFKNFDFSASFLGSQGNEIANIMTYYYRGSDVIDNNLLKSRVENAWTGPGSTNTEPRLTESVTQNDWFSDRYIEDGSFLRLRNVQLGYTLPSQVTSKIKLSRVRFYLSADNLLTFTDYSGFDPEVGLAFNGDPFGNGVDLGNYPQPRTIIFGTNIKF
ncbi:SusC/RagA family TonB-linked outer membrane protein [Marinigracilibium pacificum]|uniref:TonB-dependent receptor n=1 Tax=Marinigracilibium pacificum TaxID=2729599 RepID=A0A848J429_9BACT|nr:TonB-dependent receptor [Marinigracilibium pacificum]NMM49280.1 TonB-dependent receptor [Marinigracilibium pacificum]